MARLLLVDDDPVLLRLLSKILSRAGHTITLAESGPACLAIAAQQPFDLIITDVMMPEMDGFALAQALRLKPELACVRILVFTSRLHGPDPELARRAGADGWAMKTVQPEHLLQLVNQLLAVERPVSPA
jgi:CheY-like chemotaxis protein